VSQLHARVFHKEGSWLVAAHGATNRTYVNTNRVSSPRPLKRGDHIKIGAVVMEAEV
jgi:pSer/pThr/pTyr-binding forkhead associated (FHA) protein